MTAIGSGYDLSASTYSRDGRVFQVEYAQKAIEMSGTALAACVKDGVVFAVEKIVTSKMLEPSSNRRLAAVDLHVGVATAGLVADSRQIWKRARQEARDYRKNYLTAIPTRVLSDRVSGYMHSYTQFSYLRPFGVAALLGGYDEDGPKLFLDEPSGIAFGHHAAAVGKGAQGAKTELQKLNLKEMTAREAVKELTRIIYSVHDEVKDKHFIVELGWVCDESNKEFELVPATLLDAAVAEAKAKLDDDDDEDDLDS